MALLDRGLQSRDHRIGKGHWVLAVECQVMEAFNSRLKTENRSLLLDAQTPEQLVVFVAERMGY
jgi:hypothetical protein